MPSLAGALADLLRGVDRPGSFAAAGVAELLPPALEVDGAGPVALPLLPAQFADLVAAAEQAPFGRGQDTVVDPAVRRCWQIGPERVRVGGRHWARTLDGIVARAAAGLGVTGAVEASFHKLLLYGEGSFFVGHRDTEKRQGMFATLVVVLPSAHEGGDLLVRHAGEEARFSLRPGDPAEAAFAAFYADCVHEVLPVTGGCRLALVYNLVRPGGRPPEPPDHRAEQSAAAALLRDWGGPVKLVYPLEHAYTPAELGFATLKGADAAVAGVLAVAAPQGGCDLHLALLTIEEDGPADYTGNGRSRRWGDGDDQDEFEAVEVANRSVDLSDWRRVDGGAPAIGAIPVEDEELSPPGACDDLVPDDESFREATGNEGASFERTYRRAALVLWPSGRLAAVLAQAGPGVTLPYLADLADLVDRGAANGTKGAPLRHEARELAAQVIAQWHAPSGSDGGERGGEGGGLVSRLLVPLTALGDAELVRQALAVVDGGFGRGDAGAIVDAAGVLPAVERGSVIERIVRATAAGSFAPATRVLARAAASGFGGLRGAAAALVAALPGDPARHAHLSPWERPRPPGAGTVAELLAGLGAVDPALAEGAAAHLLAWPGTYGMDDVLVPAARAVPAGAPGAQPLRPACVAHLRARTAEPLAPPADWRRDSRLPCRCPFCTELSRFLDDPERPSWTLRAVASARGHVEGTIKTANCDVATATDRRGRPHGLVCTKTQASHERRVAQRKRDLADLALLG